MCGYFIRENLQVSIALLDLSANSQELLDTGQIFEGQLSLHGCVLRNVSAHSLKSLVAPLSLKHHSKMDSEDKLIWDANYDEEYAGLVFFPTWDVITEGQFHCLSKGKQALLTMTIATIKYDQINHPMHAKYHLVLGNSDYRTWSKEAMVTPVLSQLKLWLLTSLAVYHKQVLLC